MDKKLISAIVAGKQIIFQELTFTTLQNAFMDCISNLAQSEITLTSLVLNKERKVRIPNYSESWVQQNDELDFFMHFRMDLNTYHFLVETVAKYQQASDMSINFGGSEPVQLEKAILILIWYFAKGDTHASLSDRFNIGISTTHAVIEKYLDILVNLRHEFIRWPSREEAVDIVQNFKDCSGYPGVLGAIDGTHFACVVPKEQHDSYQNRKLFHSVVMQAVVDADKILRDIFVGFPGASNDGRVSRESPLNQRIESEGPQVLFYENLHLVGDKAYVCTEWLITPYRLLRFTQCLLKGKFTEDLVEDVDDIDASISQDSPRGVQKRDSIMNYLKCL